MSKKQNGGKNSKAVAPQRYISRRHLAEFFGLKDRNLLFAIAETSDDDDSVKVTPIIAIMGSQDFISLSQGEVKTSARMQGIKQDIYPAIVIYDDAKKEFTFKSSVNSSASISCEKLSEHFGKNVISY